jgi:hypothetical protein
MDPNPTASEIDHMVDQLVEAENTTVLASGTASSVPSQGYTSEATYATTNITSDMPDLDKIKKKERNAKYHKIMELLTDTREPFSYLRPVATTVYRVSLKETEKWLPLWEEGVKTGKLEETMKSILENFGFRVVKPSIPINEGGEFTKAKSEFVISRVIDLASEVIMESKAFEKRDKVPSTPAPEEKKSVWSARPPRENSKWNQDPQRISDPRNYTFRRTAEYEQKPSIPEDNDRHGESSRDLHGNRRMNYLEAQERHRPRSDPFDGSSEEDSDDDWGERSADSARNIQSQGLSAILYSAVNFMGVPESQCFYGSLENPEEAKEWLRNFRHMRKEAQWNNKKSCENFGIRMKKKAGLWFTSLSKTIRRDYQALDREFQDRYCNYGVKDHAAKYYYAKRYQGEDLRDYLTRLNVLARKAGKNIEEPGHPHAEEHVHRFLLSCVDPEIRDKFVGMAIRSSYQLEKRLQEVIRNRALKERSHKKEAPRSGSRSVKFSEPAKRMNVMDGWRSRGRSGEYDRDPMYSDEEDYPYYDEEEYDYIHSAVGGTTPRRDSENVRRWENHYKEDWQNANCAACGRNGHPTHRCLFRCRMCMQVHPYNQCERMKQLITISKWVLDKDEDLPDEIQQICKSLN